MFGIVDVNARLVKNGNTTIKQLGNHGQSANRIGFRGVEELGGGFCAGFWGGAAQAPDRHPGRRKRHRQALAAPCDRQAGVVLAALATGRRASGYEFDIRHAS